ncbi:hypothetical protein E1301_Tti018712 [Triplophysa tibetana]|uniref:Uncharacterized protein n=1 Tax=Triplophysa tibetana TaxID=1572043 RepID=A0A5A9PTL5_9TELE|nr:hypothetical protein E1301_Tti018712 [Triplophysa tibetana]
MICWMVQNDPVEEEIASQAAALLKRSKSHQFYGLMGKRSGPVTKTLSETSTSMDKPAVLNKESGMTFTVQIQCMSVSSCSV